MGILLRLIALFWSWIGRAAREQPEDPLLSLERQLASLKQNQANLERKIALFRSKKDTLKALHTSSQAQLNVQEALAGVSEELTDVNSTVERVERRIHEMQARAEAIEDLVSEGVLADVLQPETDEIDRRLARIGRRQAVEDELARLKAALSAEAVARLDTSTGMTWNTFSGKRGVLGQDHSLPSPEKQNRVGSEMPPLSAA